VSVCFVWVVVVLCGLFVFVFICMCEVLVCRMCVFDWIAEMCMLFVMTCVLVVASISVSISMMRV